MRQYINQYRVILALIFAILTTLALGVSYKVASWDIASQAIQSQNPILVFFAKLHQNFNFYALPWQICGVAIWFLYYKKMDYFQTISHLELVISFLFGTINIISNSLVVNGDWSFVFANTYQLMISLICIIGQALFFLIIVKATFNLLDMIQKEGPKWLQNRTQKTLGVFEKYTWRVSFFVLILCWIPDLIIAYPAQIPYDGVNQIKQWIGMYPINNHHPFISTWIIGILYEIGKLLGNDNITMFFIVFCISCIMAACYATVVKKIYQMNVSHYIAQFTLLFYGLHPLMGEYAHTIIKDSISIPIFTLFILEVASFVLDSEGYLSKKSNLVRLTIWSIVACLLRHNYIYAVLPTLIELLVITIRKNKNAIRAMTICVLGCLSIIQGINFFSEHVLHYPSGSIREALSVPFQQTARYIRDHSEEVTAEERAVISSVLDYDSLAIKYNPNTSDPVKATYHGDTKALRQYFEVWWHMLFKHPETYIQSAIQGSHVYYAFTPQIGGRTLGGILIRNSTYKWYLDELEMDLAHPEKLEPAFITWESMKEFIVRMPILGLLSNCAAYTWMLIILGIYYIRKHLWKAWVLLFPMSMILLTCILSPVNGNWRYYAPIVVSVPIIIAVSAKLLVEK